MNNREYGRRLHAQILRELGITQPPFRLIVEIDAGGGAATLRDERDLHPMAVEGDFVSNYLFKELGFNDVAERAKEAADAMRPDLQRRLAERPL